MYKRALAVQVASYLDVVLKQAGAVVRVTQVAQDLGVSSKMISKAISGYSAARPLVTPQGRLIHYFPANGTPARFQQSGWK